MAKVENETSLFDRLAWNIIIPVLLLALISLYCAGIMVLDFNCNYCGCDAV